MSIANIEIDGTVLVVSAIEDALAPFVIAQLEFWGFSGAKDGFIYKRFLNSTTFRKTLNYLESQNIRLQLSQEARALLSEILSSDSKFNDIRRVGANIKNGVYDLSDIETFLTTHVPRQLKPHQIKAFVHQYRIGNGANFSVPGSGKTSVVLVAYEKLRIEGTVNSLMVVGPPACFGPWKDEFEKTLGRNPEYKILAGGSRAQRRSGYAVTGAELFMTTFQSLLSDQGDVIDFLRQKDARVLLVIDEAHYIKQIGGSWATAVLNVAQYAERRCILTGTPLPRSCTDMFNLFEFLWLDQNPFTQDVRVQIALAEDTGDKEKARNLIQQAIAPLYFRVNKLELGLRQPSFHKPVKIKMHEHERFIYDAIINKIRDFAQDDYLKNIDIVQRLRRGRIIRLRQCASYAGLLKTVLEDYDELDVDSEPEIAKIVRSYDQLEIPAKIGVTVQIAAQLVGQGEKLVIWSNFVNTLHLIQANLQREGLNSKIIFGGVPTENTSREDEETRESIRAEFVASDSGLDILIANPAACAESISLHKTCFHALYYDLSYNCAQYLQSLDRIHRVGGSEINIAHYHFLEYEDTIDADIRANLEGKAQVMHRIIDGEIEVGSLDMFEVEDEEAKAFERLILNDR